MILEEKNLRRFTRLRRLWILEAQKSSQLHAVEFHSSSCCSQRYIIYHMQERSFLSKAGFYIPDAVSLHVFLLRLPQTASHIRQGMTALSK